jgi:hypothetical protein
LDWTHGLTHTKHMLHTQSLYFCCCCCCSSSWCQILQCIAKSDTINVYPYVFFLAIIFILSVYFELTFVGSEVSGSSSFSYVGWSWFSGDNFGYRVEYFCNFQFFSTGLYVHQTHHLILII